MCVCVTRGAFHDATAPGNCSSSHAQVHAASICRVRHVSNVHGDCTLLFPVHSSFFPLLIPFLSIHPVPSVYPLFLPFVSILPLSPFVLSVPCSHPFPSLIPLSIPVLAVLSVFPFPCSFLFPLFPFLLSLILSLLFHSLSRPFLFISQQIRALFHATYSRS